MTQQKIRVLFQTRFNAFERRGGDTVQLLKTKEYVEKNYPNIEIVVDNDSKINLDNFDLVHIFNLLRPQEAYLFVQNAKSQGKPVVLSTIYWKSEEFERDAQIGLRKHLNKVISMSSIERIRAAFRFIEGERHAGTVHVIKNGFENTQKSIIKQCDWFLPNGKGEIDLMNQVFNLSIDNFTVVPNAVNVPKNLDFSLNNRQGVICVGRIEPRKNQLALVKAMRDLPYDLTIIGKVNPTQQHYYELVKAAANDKVTFIQELPQEQLKKYYRTAKVHALPSWYDTPGLVSIEAGLYGCNLVVGKDGTTKEYFANEAEYVDPHDIDGIREAVITAYEKETTDVFSKRVQKEYAWDNTAKATVLGYHQVLDF